jgi:hypothetical protein
MSIGYWFSWLSKKGVAEKGEPPFKLPLMAAPSKT